MPSLVSAGASAALREYVALARTRLTDLGVVNPEAAGAVVGRLQRKPATDVVRVVESFCRSGKVSRLACP